MQNMKISPKDKKYLVDSISRVVGVLLSVKSDIEGDHACDESVARVLAAKSAVSTIGREMINRGVLQCLNEYSQDELADALKLMFKLD